MSRSVRRAVLCVCLAWSLAAPATAAWALPWPGSVTESGYRTAVRMFGAMNPNIVTNDIACSSSEACWARFTFTSRNSNIRYVWMCWTFYRYRNVIGVNEPSDGPPCPHLAQGWDGGSCYSAFCHTFAVKYTSLYEAQKQGTDGKGNTIYYVSSFKWHSEFRCKPTVVVEMRRYEGSSTAHYPEVLHMNTVDKPTTSSPDCL